MDGFMARQAVDLQNENRLLIRDQPICKGDSAVLTWVVCITRGGAPVDLTGAQAWLYCARPGGDGEDAPGTTRSRAEIEGTNVIIAELPDDAANYPGTVGCTIRIVLPSGRGYCAARMAVQAVDLIGQTIDDVGRLIPSIDEVTASLTRCDEAARAAEDAVAAANAAAEEARRAAEMAAPWSAAPTAISLPSGSAPTVTVTTGEDGERVLSFGIPQGEMGPQGPEGPKGADGTMTFEDLTDEQRESLRGPQGETGPQGIQGTAGVGIASIARTAGDGSPGTTDTYTITFTDGQTLQYGVTHGKNGATADQTLNTTDTVTFKSVSAETVTANKVIGAVYA